MMQLKQYLEENLTACFSWVLAKDRKILAFSLQIQIINKFFLKESLL